MVRKLGWMDREGGMWWTGWTGWRDWVEGRDE